MLSLLDCQDVRWRDTLAIRQEPAHTTVRMKENANQRGATGKKDLFGPCPVWIGVGGGGPLPNASVPLQLDSPKVLSFSL